MSANVVIYHNPRCSKSRETLALLQSRGLEPRIIEYLKNPPTPAELRGLLSKLGFTPAQLMRAKEAAEAGLTASGLTEEQVIVGMCLQPQVIERPIVVAGGRAAIGRPPEAVLAILGDRS